MNILGDLVFVLSEVRKNHFTEDAANLINHEHGDKVDPEHGNVHLVDANVEEVQLEIGELEDEALDEDRVVPGALRLVVLHIGGPVGDLAEVNVHNHCNDSLTDGSDHVGVALGVEELTWLSHFG